MDQQLIDYFIQRTDKRFEEMKADQKELHRKVDELLAEKHRRTGVLITVSAIFTAIWSVIVDLFKGQ